jgi:predicted permease
VRAAGFSSFYGLAGWGVTTLDLSSGGESRIANAMWVSGEFFDTVGVRPAAGRLIGPADDVRGCGAPGVVLSHRFWQREYGGAADAVGRDIRLDGRPLPIVGVAAKSFFGLEVGRSFDVAVPICAQPLLQPQQAAIDQRSVWWLAIIGRLAPGVSTEEATAELEGRSAPIFAATVDPDYIKETAEGYLAFKLQAVEAWRGFSGLRTEYDEPLRLLLGIAGLVLLIACANLANLLLARATAREREIAVRLAIGASRRRIVSQLLAESLLLAGIGALAGFGLARVLSQALVALLASDGTPLYLAFETNWRVLGFTTALAITTCLVFGLVPAIRATRTSPETVMRAHGRGLTASRERFTLRRALVVGQMAVSLVLVAGSLLFARSFSRLAHVDAGFDPDPVLRVDLDLRPAGVQSDQLLTYYARVIERLRAVPGVVSASYADIIPMTGSGWNQRVVVDGERKDGTVYVNRVSPAYFETMQTPIVAGRDVSERDTVPTPAVAIVNDLFAEKYFGGGQVLGRRFQFAAGPNDTPVTYEVVGPRAQHQVLRAARRVPADRLPGGRAGHRAAAVPVGAAAGQRGAGRAPRIGDERDGRGASVDPPDVRGVRRGSAQHAAAGSADGDALGRLRDSRDRARGGRAVRPDGLYGRAAAG